MAPSTPQGLLIGSKREHPFHLSGIHTQQFQPNDTLSPGQTGSLSQAALVPPLLWRASSYPQSSFQSSTGHTQRHKSSSTSELREQQSMHHHRAVLWQLFIGRGSCLQLHQLHQSASSSVLTIAILGFQPLTFFPNQTKCSLRSNVSEG